MNIFILWGIKTIKTNHSKENKVKTRREFHEEKALNGKKQLNRNIHYLFK